MMKTLSILRFPLLICFVFFLLYTALGIIRHNHYESYGFDLGITDQIVWEYSSFHAPITTVHYYPYTSILTDHVELIYPFISIGYWLWNDPRMLLILQAAFVSFAAIPLYLYAKEKSLHPMIVYAIMISYLAFYGVQNALWFDVHSAAFGASFIPWFLYFLEKKRLIPSLIFFFLAIISKENMAFITFTISLYFFIIRRKKSDLLFMLLSVVYLFLIFEVYFPHFTKLGYEYVGASGMPNLDLRNYADNANKRQVFLVSLGWFGLLPLLSPLSLLSFFGDLFVYFVIAFKLHEADSIFMHYRITSAALLAWSTILGIARFKRLNTWYTGVYLLVFLAIFQYTLHLPLSYFAKGWFIHQSPAVATINDVLKILPKEASVVSQDNITPHIAHRKEIFTLWPEKKHFAKNSPCGASDCNWFRWGGKPQYLIVDTSSNWDIRHLLANRPDYIDGLHNIEKAGYIVPVKKEGNTVLYKVIKNPDHY